MSSKQPVLISACLIGLCTRYDGKTKEHPSWQELTGRYHLIPVCPEQLGGLPTPRPPADLVDGDGFDVLDGKARVMTKDNLDVTAAFCQGAEQTLEAARKFNCTKAILKLRSPSCSTGVFAGVATALLIRNGIEVEGL